MRQRQVVLNSCFQSSEGSAANFADAPQLTGSCAFALTYERGNGIIHLVCLLGNVVQCASQASEENIDECSPTSIGTVVHKSHDVADRLAARFARLGVNCVRLQELMSTSAARG